MLDRPWNTLPSDLKFAKNEVHVWRTFLKLAAPAIQNLRQTLSREEDVRASKFYFEKDRRAFIIARGVLRTILGRYLDTEPDQISFCYNPYGKPALDVFSKEMQLNFSLSHSHELAMYAFTYSRQIGIDVEYMRSDVDYEQLAIHSFSQCENDVFLSLPDAVRQQAFFSCWTRKEAYIKARGKGLSIPLNCFDVSLRPGEPAALLNSREDPQGMTRWSLRDLYPGPGYAGALAVEGCGWHLSCWQWQL